MFLWSVMGGYELQNLEVALALAHVPDLEAVIERLVILRVEFNRPEKRSANG